MADGAATQLEKMRLLVMVIGPVDAQGPASAWQGRDGGIHSNRHQP